MAQIWIILCSSMLRVQWTEHASSVQLKSKALILFMKHEQTYQSSQDECALCMAHGSSNTNIKAFNVFNILNSIKWLIGTIYFMKKKKVKNTDEKKKQYMRRHLFNACTHGLMHSQIYTWHIKYVIVECCSLLSGLRLYNNKLKDFFPIISFAWLLFH